MKSKTVNYRKWVTILQILLMIFFVLTSWGFWYNTTENNYYRQYIFHTTDLKTLVARFLRNAGEFVNEGKEENLNSLKMIKNQFAQILDYLKNGQMSSSGHVILPPSPENIENNELRVLLDLWNAGSKDADTIIANKDLIINLYNIVRPLTNAIDKIITTYVDILSFIANKNSPHDEIYGMIGRQLNDAHQIEIILWNLLDYEISLNKMRDLPIKVNDFDKGLQELKIQFANKPLYTSLLDIERNFIMIRNRTEELVQSANTLVEVYVAWNELRNLGATFYKTIDDLELAYTNDMEKRIVNSKLISTLSIITIFILILLFYVIFKDNKTRLQESQREVNKLVEELQGLGHGDLSVRASTTSEFTAAIAEAINYSILALRKLVIGINQTSQKVSDSALEVRKITKELVQSIHNQSDHIVETTHSVNVMAKSIDQVSNSAQKSAEFALRSLDIAHEGAVVVKNTMEGMKRIAEQIHETENFIQHLSESSTEIGDMVSLINDISEQTNILSLNAAIQAAMAGDVGLGFSVVADEVQQLAVKSSQATKEVEGIVKYIRNDTERAASSMLRAIRYVNEGSALASNAGIALTKIENVSKELAESMQHISKETEDQAKVANDIKKMMEIIEAIAAKTAEGTTASSQSIDTLASEVQELHNLVQGFKLKAESDTI